MHPLAGFLFFHFYTIWTPSLLDDASGSFFLSCSPTCPSSLETPAQTHPEACFTNPLGISLNPVKQTIKINYHTLFIFHSLKMISKQQVSIAEGKVCPMPRTCSVKWGVSSRWPGSYLCLKKEYGISGREFYHYWLPGDSLDWYIHNFSPTP
jgi:hypothetical protein